MAAYWLGAWVSKPSISVLRAAGVAEGPHPQRDEQACMHKAKEPFPRAARAIPITGIAEKDVGGDVEMKPAVGFSLRLPAPPVAQILPKKEYRKRREG